MRVIITDAAQKDIERLDLITARRAFEKIEWLNTHFDERNHLGLSGMSKGYFKLRVGDWRILYNFDIERQVIFIHLVDHRSRVYKRIVPS